MIAIGIDLGGTNIKAALVHHKKGIMEKETIPTHADLGPKHVLGRIADLIRELEDLSKDTIIGIGMGIPGMVNVEQTTVFSPPNLHHWEEVNVSEEIQMRTGMKCRIENDANVAALGSSYFGRGRDFESFVMVTLGTGVGGGIIYSNKIYKGTRGMAGELGHVIIDYHGPLSNSVTRGTIEAYLGQRFLSRYAADLIMQNPKNELYAKFNNNFDKLEPLDLYHAAEEGNDLAILILKKSGTRLGYAIVNYVHILDIRKFVVSGGVAKAGHWLLEPAKDAALKYLMPPYHDGFEIFYEDLGNDGALLGAASLAFQSFS